MNKVTIIGSINVDTNLQVDHLACPGETIRAKESRSTGGGKGANQAVAAQRLGAEVSFIGAIGNDAAGQKMRRTLKGEGIDVTGIKVSEKGTGQAYVEVEDSGQNTITIYPGANDTLNTKDVEKQSALLQTSDLVVSQLETPQETTIAGFKLAKENNVKTILNPAPAKKLPSELLELCDLIVPNETEAQILTGVQVIDQDSAQRAAQKLIDMGVAGVVITLGIHGAYYNFKKEVGLLPALKVKTVDTTAAGDTFVGALASFLNKKLSNLQAAIEFANRASSLTVQRRGAQAAIPFYREL